MSEQEPEVQATEETVVEQAQTESSEGLSVDALSAQLVAANARVAELQDQALRVSADMQNLRRRTERDVENAHKYALEKFATDLLPVIDSLERGLQSAGNDESTQALREGVELTLRMFGDALRKYGVEVIEGVGQPFKPELHEAMSMQPSADHPANTVMAVLQKGYTLNGRLVRPAMVVVSRGA